jgi:hypothetical protein
VAFFGRDGRTTIAASISFVFVSALSEATGAAVPLTTVEFRSACRHIDLPMPVALNHIAAVLVGKSECPERFYF